MLLCSRYMVPLFLVYLAEYTINQGVAPTLLFPLAESPFKHFVSFERKSFERRPD